MWSRCIAAAAGAVAAAATRRRAYAANDDEGTPATTLVGAGALPNYSLRLSIVHFALILHAAAGPSGRVSPIDSSGSRSIRTGASIPVAPPVKQTNLMSFFAANSARTVVARDKPVVVASQAMGVGNRWWDDDEEVQIDEEAEKKERMKRAYESAQEWAKFFLRVTPPAPAASSSSTTLLEDLAQMQRTSEKPDTLRSEKRERDWLAKGKKHGDFSSGDGLEALKQAVSIAKVEQAKNLRTAAISEKKAKSLAIAKRHAARGVEHLECGRNWMEHRNGQANDSLQD